MIPVQSQKEANPMAITAVEGLFWSYSSFAVAKLFSFVSMLVLARVLLPAQFGQFALVLVLITYLQTVGDLGVGAALIYERKRLAEAADVTFLVSLVAGAICAGIMYLSSGWLANFFSEPRIQPVLEVMSLYFPIRALGNAHDALLRKELAFKTRFVPELARAALKGLVATILALAGFGVWSLVWGQLLGAALAVAVLWRIVPWRPGLRLPRDLLNRMLRYGVQIVSVNALSAVVHHGDFVIVGHLLGSTALGFYSIAYRIPELTIATVIWMVGSVAFPAYSKLGGNKQELREAFLVTLKYLSLITLPMGFGLALLARPAVVTFFGRNWEPAVPIVQALAVALALRSLGTHAGDVYKATGRPDILIKVALIRALVLIPALVYFARFGAAGVALAVLGVTMGSTLLNLVIAGRVLSLPLLRMLGQFRISAIGSLSMVAVLYLLAPLVFNWPSLMKLLAGCVGGFSIYLFFTWVLGREMLETFRTIAVASWGRTSVRSG